MCYNGVSNQKMIPVMTNSCVGSGCRVGGTAELSLSTAVSTGMALGIYHTVRSGGLAGRTPELLASPPWQRVFLLFYGCEPIGPFGLSDITRPRKKTMEKEKSPTRRSGAAQTGLFCVRVLLATGCTLRVCDSADRLHAEKAT